MAVWNIRDQRFCDGLKDLCRVFNKYGGNLTLVEVGVFKGESTRIFRDSGAFSKIYSVDPWDPNIDTQDGMNYHDVIEEAEKEFRETFKDDKRIIPVKGTLQTFIQKFKNVKVDVVYIDAAHNYEDCKNDILNALNYVKPKIAICGHDYNDPEYSLEMIDQPGVRKAVEEIFGLPDRSFLDTSWVKWLNGHERENEMSLDYDFLMKNAQMINCESDPDRLELQKKIFEYHKLPFPNVFKACTTSDPGTASPACTSHKRIIEDALARDLPYVLIFEDDCYFINGIVDKLKDAISRVPDDADILQISYAKNDNSRKLKYNRIFNDCLCIACYIIFKKCYQKVIDIISSGSHVDTVQNKVTSYVLNPLICIQYNFNTANFGNYGYDIHQLNENEKQLFKNDYPKIEDIVGNDNHKFTLKKTKTWIKNIETVVKYFIEERNYRSFLHLGVKYTQGCFDNNKTSIKIGVDPDESTNANAHITSEEWFDTFQGQFDIIVIDSCPHEHSRVYGEIANSLRNLKKDGVVILHDMLPPTEDCQDIWRNGDGWKAFVKYRKNSPYECYVIGFDQGVGIIDTSKQKTDDTSSLPNDMEMMTWQQFVENRDKWMNVKPPSFIE